MKPYDLQVLLADLKSKGLNVAEDGAKQAVDSVLNWVVESAKLSPSPLDDIAVIVVTQMKPKILAELDKIDGQVG